MPRPTTAAAGAPRARRGSALILTLLVTAALGALAMSAIFLSSNAGILSRVGDREADLRTAADAAIQLGKNRISYVPDLLPNTGYVELPLANSTITGADNQPLSNVTVRLWVGPTGSTTDSAGTFASIVADAKDERGGHAVRRLEVLQESFARFAYFSNSETNFSDNSPISFACNDQLQGPVFSNSVINMVSGCLGAGSAKPTFLSSVGTAKTLNVPGDADLRQGYQENQRPISLPDTSRVTSNLRPRATAAGLAFTANAGGNALSPTMRLEFLPVDMTTVTGNPDPTVRGFVRVFKLPANPTARQLQLLHADFDRTDSYDQQTFCGDWFTINGVREFYPISAHRLSWVVFRLSNPAAAGLYANNAEYQAAKNQFNDDVAGNDRQEIQTIMSQPGARCFPAGAPELWITEWLPQISPAVSDYHGGTAATYVPNKQARESGGRWQLYGTPSTRVDAARSTLMNAFNAAFTGVNGSDASYLFPLDPAYNSSSQRVIDVQGPTAVSGVVRGKYTLHSSANLVLIDDLEYFTPPGAASGSTPANAASCRDILGIVSSQNVIVADNAIMTPQNIDSKDNKTTWQPLGSLDGSPDATVHGIIMTLGTSWYVDGYNTGPTTTVPCAGSPRGRGCLWLVGGLIQVKRGAVSYGTATYGSGYLKRYTYDLCAVLTPPPYFPTTGRYLNNRYAEIDPANFDVQKLFSDLQPNP